MSETQQHILVCDDEAEVRDMLAEYLTRRGFHISPAGSADELRAALEAEMPDLILLDINMPGESGLSVLKSLNADQNPPVIMLTAASDVVDRIIGLEMGADDYLGKPVDLRELEARIKAVLRRKAAPAAETPQTGEDARQRFRFGKTWLDLKPPN